LELNISIKEISEVSYKQSPLPIPQDEIIYGKNLIFGLGFDFSINTEKELFDFNTLIRYLIEGTEEPILELETLIRFHVINLQSVVSNSENGQLDIDDNFLSTLMGVCIGTSRGILSNNTKGTVMSKYPLPLLNPSDILNDIKKKDSEQ
jgi:hypothetical protein